MFISVQHLYGVKNTVASRGHCQVFRFSCVDVGVYEWAFGAAEVFGVGLCVCLCACGGKGHYFSFVFPLHSSFSSVPTPRW